MAFPVGSALEIKQIATPSAAAPAGTTQLYFKSDGLLYRRNGSTEAAVDTTGGGSPTGAAGGDLTGSTYPNPVVAAGAITTTKLGVTVGGDNLLVNSNFLNTGSLPVNFGAASVATEATTTWRNGRSIKVTSGSATNAFGMGANALSSEAISVRLQPNTIYTFSAWLYNPTASAITDVRVVSSGTGLTTNPSAVSTTKDAWVRLSITATTAATTSNSLTFRTGSSVDPPNGSAYYVGAWQLETGDVGTAYQPQTAELLPGVITPTMLSQSYALASDPHLVRDARVVISSPVTLASCSTTQDGQTLVQNDRVLLTGQTSLAQNGIYTVGVVAAGLAPLTRHTAFNTSLLLANAGLIEITSGTVGGGTAWVTTFKATDTLDTTSMYWFPVANQPQVLSTTPSNTPRIGDLYYDTSAPTYSSSGAASLSGNNTFTGQNGFLALTQFTPYVQFTSAQTTSTPSGGSTTGANVFVRHKAKNVLAYSDYLGEDHRVQDALYANSWQWVQAVNNNATPSTSGIAVTVLNNAGAAATAVALASTNFYAGRKRFRIASTTTAATAGELRAATADSYISATANDGGFFFVARFGLNTVATNTRGFVGLTTFTTAYPAATNPGAGLNQIGFYWDTGMTTIHFINSSGTLGTSIDMGANFPTSASAATYFYEASIWMPAGSATVCNFSITRLNDALATATTSGSTGSGSNFPAAGTLLAWHLFYGNGSNAVAHAMDIQSVYLLSDN